MREKRFECVFVEDKFGGTSRRLKDNETNITYMTCDVADLLNFQNTQIKILKEQNEILIKQNDIYNENEQLKKLEKINMEYAEQIVEENQKLRIAKNDLRIENEQLRKENKRLKERNDELEDELEESSTFIIEQREENKQLRLELETHKHPLWSTREAERRVNKLSDSLADEVKKNGLLNEELNQLRIENERLKSRNNYNLEDCLLEIVELKEEKEQLKKKIREFDDG